MKPRRNRVVLAYSGGLTSSAAIPWLAETYGAEIITITLDLGQGGELEEVRDRALANGAVRAHVLDVREELARSAIVRAIKADVVGDDRRPLVTALARPILAAKLVEIAGIEQATAVAHGETARGAAASPLDVGTRALAPSLTVIAAAREMAQAAASRAELIEYARARSLVTRVTPEQPYSVDATFWGRTVDATGLDLWAEPPGEIFTLTSAPDACPAEPAFLEIAFERGVPTAVNGVAMPLIELFETVAMIAGAHGVGRIDTVEQNGAERTRQLAEAPAAVVVHLAHADLQKLMVPAAAARFARQVAREYVEAIESGAWVTPFREALDVYVDKIQERVTGAVRLRLSKGECRIVGRRVVEPKTTTKKLRVVAAKTH